MSTYSILKITIQDKEINTKEYTKGSKEKYWAKVAETRALIKRNELPQENKPALEFRTSNVSEKIYSEICHFLDINCVKTDLATDFDQRDCIVSYDYNPEKARILSGDELYLEVFQRKSIKDKREQISLTDYTYQTILQILINYSHQNDLIYQFNQMMLVDILTGETDRHFENWGIKLNQGIYNLLPIFDNSTCLLHQYQKNKKIMVFPTLIKFTKVPLFFPKLATACPPKKGQITTKL